MSECKKDNNLLRELHAMGKGQSRIGTLTPTYLRWCDECNTVYILTPEELIPVEMEIPLLEYTQLHQVEVI